MNDFSEIENELKKLQPLQPSAELFARVDEALAWHAEAERRPGDLSADEKIIRPDRFRLNWLSLGLGLAATAVLLVFVRSQFESAPQPQTQIASISPAPVARSTTPSSEFIPAGATQVVYHMQDEGLQFPAGSEQPMRRVRSRVHETLQWQNRATGASLAVSYPTEQIELIPVSGQ